MVKAPKNSYLVYKHYQSNNKRHPLQDAYVNLTKIYEKKCFTLTSQICVRI